MIYKVSFGILHEQILETFNNLLLSNNKDLCLYKASQMCKIQRKKTCLGKNIETVGRCCY